jgi:hypothetical protein
VTRRGRASRSRVAAAVAATALLLGLAAPAGAVNLRIGEEQLRLDISETLIFAYHFDNLNQTYADDRYYEVQSRLNLGLAYKNWRLAVRVDTSLYFNHGSCDEAGNCTAPSKPPHLEWWPPLNVGELRNRFQDRSIDRIGPVYLPERLALSYAGRNVEVTLGDHYVSLGRGLVLSLRKVDELGSDTALRGGRVVVREGPATGTLVAGVTNIVNVDEATGRSSPDPLDLILGLRTEVQPIRQLSVAFQGAAIIYHNDAQPNQAESDRSLLGGLSLEVRDVPILHQVYLEYAHALRSFAGSDSNGDALYGAITHYRGPLTLLLEGKYYQDYPMVGTSLRSPTDSFSTIRYNNPPTVERVLADLDTISDVLNVGGLRLRADHKASSAVNWFASYGYFYDWSDRGARLDIHDPFAGATLAWQHHRSHATLSGGVRLSQERANTDPEYPLHGAESHSLDAHVEVVATQAITQRLSLEVVGRHRYRNKRLVGEVNRWHEGEWAVGFRWSPSLVVAAGYEYTTDPAKPHPPCGEVGEPVCATYDRMNFFNGQVGWTFRQGSSIRLFAGGQRGGLRCVSGVCRVFPSFQGVKAEAVLRF